MVITLDNNKRPLGVCTERRARILMEKGRARIYRYYPFAIIIKDKDVQKMENLPKFRIKIDPGAKQTGIAVVREDTGEFVFGMEIEHRAEQIVEKLETHKNARGNRRQRETRYRKPKWGNKTLGKGKKPQYDSSRPDGWLPPSVRYIAEQIIGWVKRLARLFNITECSFEANRFDTQLMDNPDIEGEEYQHGTLYGYEIREYLLDRYGHKCQYCGGRSRDSILEWEHIVPKSKGGSDKVSNAALSCHTCSQDKGSKALSDWLTEEQKIAADEEATEKRRALAEARTEGIAAVMAGKTNAVSDRYCAWANNLRKAVEKELFGIFGSVECSTGGRTKYNRTVLDFPKKHHYDALCVGSVPQAGFVDRTNGYYLSAKAVGHGTRYRGRHNACGIITRKPKGKTPKRRFKFQNGDIVRAVIPSGKYKGAYTDRVMTRASGYFSIRTLDGGLVEAKHTFCTKLQPDNGYQYTVRKV